MLLVLTLIGTASMVSISTPRGREACLDLMYQARKTPTPAPTRRTRTDVEMATLVILELLGETSGILREVEAVGSKVIVAARDGAWEAS